MTSASLARLTLCLAFVVGSCSEYKVANPNKVPNGTETSQGDDDDFTTSTTDTGWQWTPTGDDDDDTVPGDDDDDFTTGTGITTTGGSGTTPGTWDTGDWDLCEWAEHIAGFLDAYNIDGDGKVVYCHQSGGPNYIMQDTSTAACLTHIAHLGDIFPTTICDS